MTAQIISGTASATEEGEAAGAVIEIAVSTLAGAASGGAQQPGEVTAVSAALVAGGVAGAAEASGATVETSASLIAGTATGGAAGDGFADGTTLEATVSLIAGTATGVEVAVISGGRGYIQRREDAVAYGDLLVCRARLLSGRVTTVSLLAGSATGDAVAAANDNIEAVARLIPGTAAGERNFADEELLMIFAEAA
jgi:hypothetical protein